MFESLPFPQRAVPPLARIKQRLSSEHIADVRGETRAKLLAAGLKEKVKPGARVAVTAGGFWTDITRTFCLGEPDERKQRMYDAVFAVRRAALETIVPGVRAATVDAAARSVLEARGFGAEFKHGLGHGVGFAAINHNAPPRLHPASNDILETGMVFNIEPAIYVEGYGGMRHCDMVAVGEAGAELLTPFQSTVEELTVI